VQEDRVRVHEELSVQNSDCDAEDGQTADDHNWGACGFDDFRKVQQLASDIDLSNAGQSESDNESVTSAAAVSETEKRKRRREKSSSPVNSPGSSKPKKNRSKKKEKQQVLVTPNEPEPPDEACTQESQFPPPVPLDGESSTQ
jgi:hypothetical protein